MTLSEGISKLCSSDGANNALIHDSWKDGKYIQLSTPESGKSQIKVLSKIDMGFKSYQESPFSRKDFASIKNFGWRVVSPEELITYCNHCKNNDVELSNKQNELEISTICVDEVKNSILVELKQRPNGTDPELYKFCEKFINSISLKKYNAFDFSDLYNYTILPMLQDAIIASGNKELYRKFFNMGLTNTDLDWLHGIELSEGIIVRTDDLNDFGNRAAINLVRKRIQNELNKKVGL